MLKWFRERAGTSAMLVLWSFTAVGALSAAHEFGCDDELAEGFVVSHAPGSHTLAATHTSQKPLHCVLCHWLQSFRAGSIRATRIVIAQEFLPARMVSLVQPTRAVARHDLPSRAPPA
jgi:hypothetical protein